MQTAAARSGSLAGSMSLARAATVFVRHGSPRIMAAVAVAILVARLAVGRWSWADAAVCGGILVVEPFLEWMIHVFLLHFRPRQVLGRRVDPLFARRHRMHHRDPRDIPLVFVPLPVLVVFLAGLFAISWFAFPPLPLKLTAFATMSWFLFGYEWTHFLIHSPYLPRSAAFRAVWRAHILHHYKNEKYWFGVTNPIADNVLRTNPPKQAVPTSPTARTLGVDDELTLLAPAAAS